MIARPDWIRTVTVSLTILATAMSMACGGGGGGSSGGPPPPTNGLVASFMPDNANPPANSVSMQAGSSSNSIFRIDVMVTDITDFFGAAFPVRFDSATATFLSQDTNGSFIIQGGVATDFQAVLSVTDPDVLLVVASRRGATVDGVTAVGSQKLISLVFEADSATAGNSFRFDQTVGPREVRACAAGQACPPMAEPPLTWHGGTLVAN